MLMSRRSVKIAFQTSAPGAIADPVAYKIVAVKIKTISHTALQITNNLLQASLPTIK